MNTGTKTVTNEEILTNVLDLASNMSDLMQMTSDGFARLDNRMERLEGRMEKLEKTVAEHSRQLSELSRMVSSLNQRVEMLTGQHKAYMNDIADILDRLVALEKKLPLLNQKEIIEMQRLLQMLVDWAVEAAKVTGTPLKLPK